MDSLPVISGLQETKEERGGLAAHGDPRTLRSTALSAPASQGISVCRMVGPGVGYCGCRPVITGLMLGSLVGLKAS